LRVDTVAVAEPAREVGGTAVLAGEPDDAVQGHPAHQPAVGEVLPAAAGLPDAIVGLVPVLAQPVGELAQLDPAGMANLDAVAIGEIDGVQHFAVDVELELAGGAVADAHRLGARIALPVV